MISFCVIDADMWYLPEGHNVGHRRYTTASEVYEAAALIATGMGDRLLTISGAIREEGNAGYPYGQLVVWYRVDDAPATPTHEIGGEG